MLFAFKTEVACASQLHGISSQFVQIAFVFDSQLERAISRFDWESDPEAHLATCFSSKETFYDLVVQLAAGADPRVIPKYQWNLVRRLL